MNIYNELRSELLGALEEYKQGYENFGSKMPENRAFNCDQIREIIRRHDGEEKAYELKQAVLKYTNNITYLIFNFLPWGTSGTLLQGYMNLVLYKAKYADLSLGLKQRDEYYDLLQTEQHAGDARIAMQKQQLMKENELLSYELEKAKREIARLQSENGYLVRVLDEVEEQEQQARHEIVVQEKYNQKQEALYHELKAIMYGDDVIPHDMPTQPSHPLRQIGFFDQGAQEAAQRVIESPQRNRGAGDELCSVK